MHPKKMTTPHPTTQPPAKAMTASQLSIRTARRTFVAAFVFIALALVGCGYWYYHTEAEAIRQSKYENIAAIAKMKAGQILQWRKERLGDATRATTGPVLRRESLELMNQTATPGVREELRKIMDVGREAGTYSNIFLVDPAGNVRLTAKEVNHPLVTPPTQRAIAAALASREPVMSDFFRDPEHVHIDTVAAVRDAEGKAVCALVLRSNAEDVLYPLMQSWPMPSTSAETVLVQREGEQIVFLNELRHQKGADLSLRISLSQTQLPGVQAVLGHRGKFEGRDHRNVPVLADLSAIPGTPWFMVTKVDADEILAEARYRAASTSVIVGALILLTGALAAASYGRKETGLWEQLLEAERQERESQAMFRTTLYSIGDGVLTADTEGRLREMNPVAEWLTGWTEAEARGKPIEEVFVIINQESRATVPNPVETVLRDGVIVGLANHTLLIARDGTEHAIADSAAPIRNENGDVTGVVLVFSDVTEEYRMRDALSRREQEYRMLFEGMTEGFASHEILCDGEGKPVDYRFLSMNPAFERMTGLSAMDSIGRTVRQIFPGIEPTWIERYGRVALTGEPAQFEDYASALGRHYTVTAFQPQPRQFAVMVEDITERKATATRIERLGQLYAALSHCNQAIVHSASVAELLPQVCRAAVEFGGMRMAWIALADEATGMLCRAAAFGSGTDYLDGLQLSTKAEHPSGRGPTGTAIRENQPVWCQDFQNDPRTAPWHERAARYGLAASASIPLARRGKPIGALTLYSDKTGVFDEEICKLLLEMADDISFALESFARKAERMEAQEALRESEMLLRESQSIASMGSYVLDIPTGLWQSSEAMDTVFGIDKAYKRNVEGWVALLHPEDSTMMADYFQNEVLGQKRTFNKEYRIIRQNDQAERWVHGIGKLKLDTQGAPVTMHGTIQDITERKQAEEQLHQTSSMLAHILNSIPQSVMWKDRNCVFLGCNEVFARKEGLASPEKIVGKTDFDFPWGAYEAKAYIADDREVMETHRPKMHIVEKHHQKDGTYIWVQTSKVPLTDSQGQVYGVLGVFEDISERKRAEATLRLQSSALQAAANAIVITDKKGVIQWVNVAFATLTGYSVEEAVGKTPSVLRSGKHDRAFYKSLWETVIAGKVWHGEIINRRKNGSLYTEEMTITPVKGSEGGITHFIAVKQDITHRKQIEEKLMQTERMESIGRLASGVAHDLNNILTPIVLSAEMLHAAEDLATRECLVTSIEECAQRGASVVNQVLTFARGSKGERTRLQIPPLIKDMEKIVKETFPKNLTITSDIPSDLWPIKGDATQIHQVLLNLCINARDAMPEGGAIRFTAENAQIDENFAAMVPDAKAGDYAMLALTDTGTGIPQEIIPKIFDPFFTTKEVGKGTGLGLSTVMGIVRSHGGFVTVESAEGYGTTFKLFLPLATDDAAQPGKVQSKNMPQGKGATILVVDDESSIATSLSLVLGKNGYKVLTAADGTSALALFREHADKIKLVLTDVMMPEMDGVELVRVLKEINPQVKIIASTGHASEIHQAELQALGVTQTLHKPYDARKLLETLHETLQKSVAV